ncbi:MAG: 7-cyano-7-deazaguanine synthase QueC [Pirellulales bacterium]|jgi:7-cyano-7-deazaguanine synthase|nr:7-cyano-7-deazaguanine synthase QueC [Pirellulales bacterium]
MDKVVVILSGGMDSTTLLYHMMHAGHGVKALSVNYGQRHVRELDAAAQICRALEVEHQIADLRAIGPLLGSNSLTSESVDVPHGHYEEESMKMTVVPNRNMLMISVAVAWAVSLKFDAVAYGAHTGDHAIYPDCREAFADALDRAVQLCDWHSVKLLRPFVGMDKGDIARRGHELAVPFETCWTCYEGGEKHCGKCGACQERIEAFAKFNIADRIEYEHSSV